MLPKMIRDRVIAELAGAPVLLANLLEEVTAKGAFDNRLDPERFSIREVYAHLADYDQLFIHRIVLARDTERTTIAATDPGKIAIDNDYAHSECATSLARLTESRMQLVALLKELNDEQWARALVHPHFGDFTIEAQAVLVSTHDSLHQRQIVEWLG